MLFQENGYQCQIRHPKHIICRLYQALFCIPERVQVGEPHDTLYMRNVELYDGKDGLEHWLVKGKAEVLDCQMLEIR